MARTTDIVIVGGGVFGLWCAWAAVQAGMAPLLLERATVGAGASGGLVGALAPHTPDRWTPIKAFQFEALCQLPQDIAVIEGMSGLRTGYGQIGRLHPLMSERARDRAYERITGAAAFWEDRGQLSWQPADSAEHWINPAAAPFGFLHDTVSARLHPRATCLALAQAIRMRGGIIQEGVTVQSIASGHVITGQGDIFADHIIIAAGVDGFDLLEPLVGVSTGGPEKGQAAVLEHDAPHDTPLFYGEGVYILPHANGTVAIGSTSEKKFEEPFVCDHLLEEVIAKARHIAPALVEAPVVARWAGLRPRANDRDPMIGPVPGVPGVYAALGGFKIGFGIGAAVGRTLISGALNAGDWPEAFAVSRHFPR